jgi:hypothetical protein
VVEGEVGHCPSNSLMPVAAAYVSSRYRQVTPKRRETGALKEAATAPYMLRADWDRSTRLDEPSRFLDGVTESVELSRGYAEGCRGEESRLLG